MHKICTAQNRLEQPRTGPEEPRMDRGWAQKDLQDPDVSRWAQKGGRSDFWPHFCEGRLPRRWVLLAFLKVDLHVDRIFTTTSCHGEIRQPLSARVGTPGTPRGRTKRTAFTGKKYAQNLPNVRFGTPNPCSPVSWMPPLGGTRHT